MFLTKSCNHDFKSLEKKISELEDKHKDNFRKIRYLEENNSILCVKIENLQQSKTDEITLLKKDIEWLKIFLTKTKVD